MQLGFVTEQLGIKSEIWMWRQLKSFNLLTPNVFTWNYENKDSFPVSCHITLANPNAAPPHRLVRFLIKRYRFFTRNAYAYAPNYSEVNHWLNKQKIDRILCHYGHIGLRILHIAKRNNIPIACHFHGYDVSKRLYNDQAYKHTLLHNLQKFNAIIVVGSHQKQWMIDHGVNPQKVHLIPCGVPTVDFPYTKRTPDNDIKFLIVSRLVPKKGIKYSIDAFNIVRKNIGCQLTIIGDGPLLQELKEYINKLKICDQVKILGEQNSNTVLDYMKKCDIFLQHSVQSKDHDEEGFGVSVAEAASTGLPLVCSNSPGLKDQIVDGKNGFLTPQRDAQAMAEKMLLLAKDYDLRIKMGYNAHLHVKENFDTASQVKKLEQVLIEMR